MLAKSKHKHVWGWLRLVTISVLPQQFRIHTSITAPVYIFDFSVDVNDSRQKQKIMAVRWLLCIFLPEQKSWEWSCRSVQWLSSPRLPSRKTEKLPYCYRHNTAAIFGLLINAPLSRLLIEFMQSSVRRPQDKVDRRWSCIASSCTAGGQDTGGRRPFCVFCQTGQSSQKQRAGETDAH